MSWVLELRPKTKKNWRILLVRPENGLWQIPSSELGLATSWQEFWDTYLANYQDVFPNPTTTRHVAASEPPVGGFVRYRAFVSKARPNSYRRGIAKINPFTLQEAAGLRTTALTRQILIQLMVEESLHRQP